MEEKTNVEATEKTYTQADIDRIVGERLSREKAKYADYDELKSKAAQFDEVQEANKSELQKAQEKAVALQTELDQLKAESEVRTIRASISEKTGVPVSLLTGTTEEECKAQAESIQDYAKTAQYPSVKDAGSVKTELDTKDQFANWLTDQIGG